MAMLLVFGAPCQLQSLAGQEHGQTIPLADMSPEMLNNDNTVMEDPSAHSSSKDFKFASELCGLLEVGRV
jgi:hypothetical protein